MTTPLLDDIGAELASAEALYKDVHRHPELSTEEERTAALAAEHVADAYEVTTGVGAPGWSGCWATATARR